MSGTVSTGPVRARRSNGEANGAGLARNTPTAHNKPLTASLPDGGRAEAPAQPHSPSRGRKHRLARSQLWIGGRTTISRHQFSAVSDSLSNCFDRLRHDQIHA